MNMSNKLKHVSCTLAIAVLALPAFIPSAQALGTNCLNPSNISPTSPSCPQQPYTIGDPNCLSEPGDPGVSVTFPANAGKDVIIATVIAACNALGPTACKDSHLNAVPCTCALSIIVFPNSSATANTCGSGT